MTDINSLTIPASSVINLSDSDQKQLAAILLGSNATANSRWTQQTGLIADISNVGYVPDGLWSTSCNLRRTGHGTLAVFARANGGVPDIAGFMICTDEPAAYEEVDDEGIPILDAAGDPVTGWYIPGPIHGWPAGVRVPGIVAQHMGWPLTRAPFGAKAVRQFRNGEQLTPSLLTSILDALPETLVRTMVLEHRNVTGLEPDWA